jgi:hypothetical protein
MNSSTFEVKEERAQNGMVTEDSLIVDLVDGRRSSCRLFGIRVYGMELPRNGANSSSVAEDPDTLASA